MPSIGVGTDNSMVHSWVDAIKDQLFTEACGLGHAPSKWDIKFADGNVTNYMVCNNCGAMYAVSLILGSQRVGGMNMQIITHGVGISDEGRRQCIGAASPQPPPLKAVSDDEPGPVLCHMCGGKYWGKHGAEPMAVCSLCGRWVCDDCSRFDPETCETLCHKCGGVGNGSPE